MKKQIDINKLPGLEFYSGGTIYTIVQVGSLDDYHLRKNATLQIYKGYKANSIIGAIINGYWKPINKSPYINEPNTVITDYSIF